MDASPPAAAAPTPHRRITQEHLRRAAIAAPPAVDLPLEEPLTEHNHVLELRQYWGEVLLGINHYVRPKQITFAERPDCDIFLASDGLPDARFALVRCDEEYVLRFGAGMEGEIGQADRVVDLGACKNTLAHADVDAPSTFELTMTPGAG